jgi:hypothetical protein
LMMLSLKTDVLLLVSFPENMKLTTDPRRYVTWF